MEIMYKDWTIISTQQTQTEYLCKQLTNNLTFCLILIAHIVINSNMELGNSIMKFRHAQSEYRIVN